MTELRALIVDDEQLARRGLEIRLRAIDGIEVCGQSRNGREALEHVASLRPDIVFLDIQMPGMSGFDVLRQLAGADMPLVVFVTAFDKYAIEAFEANALDYLLKPIDDERLQRAVARAHEALAASSAMDHRSRLLSLLCAMTGETLTLERALDYEPGQGAADYAQKLSIREGAQTIVIHVNDVAWIDAAGDYMCVHANGNTYVLRSTLKRLLGMLDPATFVRVHRSTVVNRNVVTAARPHINGEYFLTLACGKELKLSRSYKENLPALLPGA